ncbi:MAG TPA: hypothetical protein VEJ84_23990, partial [Acidimicrobiales bacterium]|nr:hypothetical protein [Acidimicrobiales bacterium]
MSLSTAFEVALGLTFTYLVFATVCTGAREAIAAIFNARGTALFGAVNSLIGDAQLVQKFWDHSLVSGLITARAGSTKA